MNGSTRKTAHARAVVFTTTAVVIIAIGVTMLLTLGHHGSSANYVFPAAAGPAKISRAQMMAEYAKIVPNDNTATPGMMDTLSAEVCGILASGKPTDAVITVLTADYESNATRVAQLLVSYECPIYLKSFR